MPFQLHELGTVAVGRVYKRTLDGHVPVALEHRHQWTDGREAWLGMRA